MKIASANLEMASSHQAMHYHEVRESLRMWVDRDRPSSETQNREQTGEAVNISEAGLEASSADAVNRQIDDAVNNDPTLSVIKQMLEFLTGKPVRLFDARQLAVHSGDQAYSGQAPQTEGSPPSRANRERSGYGIEYDRHESYSEEETTHFSAKGTLRTADGREIRFDLSLAMQRSYHEESNSSLRLGDAAKKQDPLVINFDGQAAQLTDRRFQFDLNADGKDEAINFVSSGSGFLSLDRNHDGKINDGSELFGPASGNGFADLAALDQDSNGWIDENDAAYKDLRVWSKDSSGADQIRTLQQVGVGAISLAAVETPFEIKSAANQLLGSVRSTGIFLQEDGKAGTIQQIDLTA